MKYTYTYEELENLFEQELNELYEDVNVCGYGYESGALLRSIDPIAFREGLLEYLDARGFEQDDSGMYSIGSSDYE